MKNKIDIIAIDNKNITNNELGIGLFLEGNYKITPYIFLQAKTAYFSTDSYNTAILQYNYYKNYSNIRTLFEQGINSYLSIQIIPITCCNLYLSFANYYKLKNEIKTNIFIPKNMLLFQIDLKI